MVMLMSKKCCVCKEPVTAGKVIYKACAGKIAVMEEKITYLEMENSILKQEILEMNNVGGSK